MGVFFHCTTFLQTLTHYHLEHVWGVFKWERQPKFVDKPEILHQATTATSTPQTHFSLSHRSQLCIPLHPCIHGGTCFKTMPSHAFYTTGAKYEHPLVHGLLLLAKKLPHKIEIYLFLERLLLKLLKRKKKVTWVQHESKTFFFSL